MLTYQLQDRVLMMLRAEPPEFPAPVTVEVTLGPFSAFGMSNEPGRLAVTGHKARLTWNSNTGRSYVVSDPPLRPLDVTLRTPSQLMSLDGNVLRYEIECKDMDELVGALQAWLYLFPALLNTQFADPPFVTQITGSIGGAPFRWQHREVNAYMYSQSIESIEGHVAQSLKRMGLFAGVRNIRLLAGMHYFHLASRLLVVGESQWEFMAEAVLNMSKSLQIMFGDTRDQVRVQLKILGYSEDEIEGDFIPLMLLRNQFDVSHPRLAVFRRGQLDILYRYLSHADLRFRDLMRRLLDSVDAGTYQITQVEDLKLDDRQQREFDRLIESMQARLPRPNDEEAA